jgi:hypothetical protein
MPQEAPFGPSLFANCMRQNRAMINLWHDFEVGVKSDWNEGQNPQKSKVKV